MKRRSSVPKMIAVLLALVALSGWNYHDQALARAPQIKHVILIISDGMQLEHEIAASRYLYGKDKWLSFHKFPYHGFMTTWDVTTYNRYALASGEPAYDPAQIDPTVGYDPAQGGRRPYPSQKRRIDDAYFLTKLPLTSADTQPKYPATDSASAATAWATGYKTDDGNIAWLAGDPDDGSLQTIAELVRAELGWAIGVVSTVPFSHATPAAHVSHNQNRNNYYAIADEIIRTVQPEVVIGGGHPLYDNARYMSTALYEEVKAGTISDYVFVEREEDKDGGEAIIDGAEAAIDQEKKLFGLFGGSGGNFEPPVPSDDGSADVQRGSSENPLFKDAAVAALEVLSQDSDGFFLMLEQGDVDWANHANDYKWMIGTMWDLDQGVKAVIDFVNRRGDDVDWSNTAVIVTADHANSYMRLNDANKLGKGDLPEQVYEGPCSYDPSKTCYNYPEGEVTYATGDHTNELVSLYAFGGINFRYFTRYAGSWYPCTRIIDNSQLFHVMAEMAGIPQESTLNAIVERPAECVPDRDDDT